MQGHIPATRRRLIARIAKAAARRKGSTPVAPPDFITQYYRGVAEEDLGQYSIETLAHAARAHLEFASKRPAGQPVVRVYNPQTATDGWTTTHTVIEATTDDMPFLVDSLGMVLARANLAVHLMVHPMLGCRRDRAGRLTGIEASAPGTPMSPPCRPESWQHIEVDFIGDDAERAELRQKILGAFEDVRLAYTDWQAMRARMRDLRTEIATQKLPLPKAESQECAALLDWLEHDHFTFLGYREYRLERGRSEDRLVAVANSGLGILRSDRKRAGAATATVLSGDLRTRAREQQLLTVTKANSISTVHRATYLDYIGVKAFDAAGNVVGERRFLGLFTSSAYSRGTREIPLLRQKVDSVIARFALEPNSHDSKAVVHALETFPRDELFQSSVPQLVTTVRGIVNLYERHRVRLFLRRDAFGRFYSCIVFVPRDRYNTQVRQRIESIIREEFIATGIESQVQLSESALARLYLIARIPQEKEVREIAVAALEERITIAVRTWEDELRAALSARLGEIPGQALADRYAGAFPAGYQEDVPAATAPDDIEQLDRVAHDPDYLGVRLSAGEGPRFHLHVSRSAAPIALSDALPVFENMGLMVITERPYRISLAGGRPIWLQNFEMQRRDGQAVDVATIKERFIDAFIAVWRDRTENDGFHRLIIVAGLTWRQAMVIRAYARFLLQTSIAFSQAYMEAALARNPQIAAAQWRLFELQFDPALAVTTREREAERVTKTLDTLLDAVTSLDEDRILRRFTNAIRASVRTNYFQVDEQGSAKRYLSIKFDSRAIADLPPPKPKFEIFVYSPRVEAVHLRMGLVARGGIRWSDRREDFRTEVLGLMKAQNVKNTLIVPEGAKGGFVPKRLTTTGTRDDVQREVVDCYRTFIRGLLDVTDNLVKGRVVPPANVVRRDGDDPYLVVAADKGTATFSDTANRIAAEYGFWLDDAFASGGSSGYDHKGIGITARGGWECVKRHFRELGRDIQREAFTVVGIGDMSGDVFGNAMLLSEHIKLVAAFNHQHIFLDPDPDPAKSLAERRRLFLQPRSTWEDYDTKALSSGGGIFSRQAKSIAVSARAQALLGLTRASLTPSELIRAVLCLPVDLLWNGGIGTYVKATDESHAEVGDRSNEAVRVNGKELRCKVVGEGGNLGLTQRGRIEYALTGGRLNTDFVDNSGGVDCSDHEVNLKILLNVATERSGLTLNERNKVLARMTEDVAALVLRDNYLQSQALSVLALQAPADLMEHAHLIRSLELSGRLDRGLEFLPSAEAIGTRRKQGLGLTRPELAILLAYGKMTLFARLIDSDVPEDPYLSHELDRYFPALVSDRYSRLLRRHRLRREIIATATTNSLVNRMGPGFARRAEEDTGANPATVARAYTIAREAFGIREVWSQIEALDAKIPAVSQYDMLLETVGLVKFTTYWLIHRHVESLQIEQQVRRLRPGLAQLARALPEVLAGVERERFDAIAARYRDIQAPAELAQVLASFTALRAGPDLVEIAAQTQLSVTSVARVYFEIVSCLSLDWIRSQVEHLEVDGHWQAIAQGTLQDDIFSLQRTLCLQVLTAGGPTANLLEQWRKQRRATIQYAEQAMKEIRSLQVMDFATLSVALQAVRRVAESSATPV